ncbi:MAG: excisionase family DNA-binding protein [Acidobacteriota bacterium]|nr:excisionase family DNA-binding protein [Acidobacteriota bacterium]
MKKDNTKIVHFNLEQAAERLGFSTLTLRRKVKSGEVSYYRPTTRGKILFTEQQLSEFEKRHTFQVQAA